MTAKKDFAEGFDLLKNGDPTGAIAAFNAGLKLNQGNALAHFFLARAYDMTGDVEDARAQYQSSLGLGLGEPQADLAKAQLEKPEGPVAQQPSPQAVDPGPSLLVTLNFIKDRIDAEPVIKFEDNGHIETYEFTNFSVDPAGCNISYNMKNTNSIIGTYIESFTNHFGPGVKLATVKKMTSMYIDNLNDEIHQENVNYANSGGADQQTHENVLMELNQKLASYSEVLSPTIYEVDFLNSEFLFLEPDVATRVTKALNHALALCGGGPPPDDGLFK
jgi:hypothetical protein